MGKCDKEMWVAEYVVCLMAVLGFLILWLLLFLCFGILYVLWAVVCVPLAVIFYLPSLGRSWKLSMKVKKWICSGWISEENLLERQG
jgi:hypothetical protein